MNGPLKDKEALEIGISTDQKTKEEIYRFRYQVYIEEMSKKLSCVDHNLKWLSDELDDGGIIYFVKSNSIIVGTMRLNFGTCDEFPATYRDIFLLDEFQKYIPGKNIISLSSRLMISPDYRGSQALYFLLANSYEFGREHGIQYNFCYCAPELVCLYEQLGFRRYTKNFTDKETGYRIPLVLITEDIQHFKRVGSPFFRSARNKNNNPGAKEWFAKRFPQVTDSANAKIINEEEFWSILTEKVRENPKNIIGLLAGLTKEESQKFLQKSVILRCEKGDLIIRSNDIGEEMFILLSGAVEVSKTINHEKLSIAILGPGDIFGEMAFLSKSPRTADVTALIDSEVLVISHNFLIRAIETYPKIISKILLNLSLSLCQRLKLSTENWLNSI